MLISFVMYSRKKSIFSSALVNDSKHIRLPKLTDDRALVKPDYMKKH